MNREIKFRAYNNGKKEWLMGYGTGSLGGFSLLGECMLLGEWSQVIDTFVFERDGHKQDDLKVMQYTGLKDKNGKEIYEGDVVAVNDNGEYFTYEGHEDYPEKYPIAWNEEGACFELKGKEDLEVSPFYGYAELEIIGNIYENPDLLALQSKGDGI